MICPYCGKENPADLAVCSFCGGPLTLATVASTKGGETPPLYDELKHPLGTPASSAEANPTPPAPEEPILPPAQAQKPPRSGIYGTRVWWIVGCSVFVCLLVGCIAAALAVYRYTNVSGFLNPSTTSSTDPTVQSQVQGVRATTQGQPSGTLLFFDDFSDTSSGWEQVDEADYSTGYYTGSYRIVVKTDMWDSWAIPNDQSFSDVIIEVAATKNSGPDDNDFGVICRYQDTDHFYYAVITSDGYYGIIKVTSDATEILGSDHLEYSDVIKQGFNTNQLRFDCVGNQLTLYASGQALDQQVDGDYASGNVGLIAGTYKNPGADILFDNFRVSAP